MFILPLLIRNVSKLKCKQTTQIHTGDKLLEHIMRVILINLNKRISKLYIAHLIIKSVFCVEKNKCFAYVELNMWDVAIGPVHYDLFLESSKAKSSRITFDIKMV